MVNTCKYNIIHNDQTTRMFEWTKYVQSGTAFMVKQCGIDAWPDQTKFQVAHLSLSILRYCSSKKATKSILARDEGRIMSALTGSRCAVVKAKSPPVSIDNGILQDVHASKLHVSVWDNWVWRWFRTRVNAIV